MKKTLLYSLAVMASLALASCAGDYDDWGTPQTNEQEASAAKGVTFTNGSEAEASAADEDGIINLVTIDVTDPNASSYTLQKVKINGDEIPGKLVDNSVQVSASELEELVCRQNKSRAAVARDLKVETTLSLILNSGEALAPMGETTGKYTPAPTPAIDEQGYYMLGQVNGNEWAVTSPVWMNKISDGVYQLKVTTTADKNWFKLYAGSNVASNADDWDTVNKGALGCKENGSEDAFGFIIYNGDSWGELQTPVIPGAGTWIVTLDMNNLTYTVQKPILYMAGEANGWATNDYLTGDDGVHYTGYMYLNQNGFKFCTEPEWKGTNYGANFDTTEGGPDIKMTEAAGYYKVDVDLESKSYVLTPIESIGVIGSASPNGWDSEVPMTYIPYNNETKEIGYWEVKDITLTDGVIKFRGNNDWDCGINWGGTADALTIGGPDMAVTAGTYDIKLYAWANGYAKCEFTKK